MKTVKFMYIGNKVVKHDNVANTGTVWNGKGDIQEVSDEVGFSPSGKRDKFTPAQRLKKFPTVWVVATDKNIEAMAAALKLQAKADAAAAEAAKAAAEVEAAMGSVVDDTFGCVGEPSIDDMNSDEIADLLPGMTDEHLLELEVSETNGKNRKGLMKDIRAEIEKRG